MSTDDDFFDKVVVESPALSAVESASRNPMGREIGIAKSVLQGYITKWLDPQSSLRDVLLAVSPRAAQFVVGPAPKAVHFESGLSWSDSDPDKRYIQIHRFFEGVQERYPLILIMDAGFSSAPSGLGDIRAARPAGRGRTFIDLSTELKINLELVIGALDETSCNDLALFLTSILGSPLRRLGGGNLLETADGSNSYQITLPLTYSASPASRQNITEDPVASKWTSSISLEVMMSTMTTVTMQQPLRPAASGIMDPNGGSEGTVAVGALNDAVVIDGPSTVRLRSNGAYSLSQGGKGFRLPPDHRWSLSDRTIAAFDARSSTLIPRKAGQVELRVYRGDHQVASKTITIRG